MHLGLLTTVVEVRRQRVGLEVLIVVEVAHSLAIALKAEERVGSHEQGRRCSLNVGACEAGHSAILQRQHGGGVASHLLALRCIEVVVGGA